MLVTQSCLTLWNSIDYSWPGSSVHGILQARILEWVAIPFSRGSSQPRDWTQVSCTAGIFTIWAIKEAQKWDGFYPKIKITWVNDLRAVSSLDASSHSCSWAPLWNSACLFSGAGKTESLEREHQTRNRVKWLCAQGMVNAEARFVSTQSAAAKLALQTLREFFSGESNQANRKRQDTDLRSFPKILLWYHWTVMFKVNKSCLQTQSFSDHFSSS